MDFSNILQYLQGLLTNKQTTQANQFGQGLGFMQQELGQQGQQFNTSQANQMSQFNTSQQNAMEQFNKTLAAKEADIGRQMTDSEKQQLWNNTQYETQNSPQQQQINFMRQLQLAGSGGGGGTPSARGGVGVSTAGSNRLPLTGDQNFYLDNTGKASYGAPPPMW